MSPSAPPSSLSSSSLSQAVRVAIRVRPLTTTEVSKGGKNVVEADSSTRTIKLAKRMFTYDSVFDDSVSQDELHDCISSSSTGEERGLLDSFLDGYNATIMAYGQTGSGKTYTMGSEAHHDNRSSPIIDDLTSSPAIISHHGLIPRFMSDIFSTLDYQKQQHAKQDNPPNQLLSYQLSASFLEVYGDDVHDLLHPDRPTRPIREDANGCVSVVGLTKTNVRNSREALNVLHEGTMHRTTAATLMNRTSSRSHAVFTIYLVKVERRRRGDGAVNQNETNPMSSDATRGNGSVNDVTTTSQLTFVDLAGSERLKKTGAEGERAREGIKINEGLLALGNVINALAADEDHHQNNINNNQDSQLQQQQRKVIHVPYRQSKLTRLLQDALGGNSQTLFLACISPSDTNVGETMSTLVYANRARNIKNAVVKNVDPTVLEIRRLTCLAHVLRSELIHCRFGTSQKDTENDEGKEKGGSYGNVEELLKREDVKEYIELLYRKADDKEKQDDELLKNRSGIGLFSSMQQSSTTTLTSSNAAISNGSSSNVVCSSSSSSKNATRHEPSSTLSGNQSTSTNNAGFSTTPNTTFPSSSNDDNSKTITSDWDVNPDEDIAILNQLLDLQHHSTEFNKLQKQDDDELQNINTSLEEQEHLLLQLKQSLQIYHKMKDRYEILMTEVTNLENEKQSLQTALEQSQSDPSKGCSHSLKLKLDRVEKSLHRARRETHDQRLKIRRAEQDTKKLVQLQNTIETLKRGKVALMKKQRTASQKHKEFMELKRREIIVLKKKETKNGCKVAGLERMVKKQEMALERRGVVCERLGEKLKKTESQLMKLLMERKKESSSSSRPRYLQQRERANNSNNQTKKRLELERGYAINNTNMNGDNDGLGSYSDEEISSVRFLLEQLVTDRVRHAALETRYDESVVSYGETMKCLVEEVKRLKYLKRKQTIKDDKETKDDDDDIHEESLKECERNVEEWQLKLELIGDEVEDLRKRLPPEIQQQRLGDCNDDDDSDDDDNDGRAVGALTTKGDESAKTMIGKLSAPVTRRLLWDVLETLTTSEFERHKANELIKRKEMTLQSFQAEVDNLNNQLETLSNNYEKRISFERHEKTSSPSSTTSNNKTFDAMLSMENELSQLKSQIINAQKQKQALMNKNQTLEQNLVSIQRQLAIQHENTAMTSISNATKTLLNPLSPPSSVETTNKLISPDKETANHLLQNCQSTWDTIGHTPSERHEFSQTIACCLENTLSHQYTVAIQQSDQLKTKIKNTRQLILKWSMTLGQPEKLLDIDESRYKGWTLRQQLKELEQERDKMRPVIDAAMERRDRLVNEVRDMMDALGMGENDKDDDNNGVLSEDVKRLLRLVTQSGSNEDQERRDMIMVNYKDKGDEMKEADGTTTIIQQQKRRNMCNKVKDMMKALEQQPSTTTWNKTITAKEDQNQNEINNYDNNDNINTSLADIDNDDNEHATDNGDDFNSLSPSFLDSCEQNVKRLRLMKSEILTSNADIQMKARQLVEDMHLSKKQVLSITTAASLSTSKTTTTMITTPIWWDTQIAQEVILSLTTRSSSSSSGNTILRIHPTITTHLAYIHSSLSLISTTRHHFATKLLSLINQSYTTLIDTVSDDNNNNSNNSYFHDNDDNPRHAYEIFSKELNRLPPLSQDRIDTIVEGMALLGQGVEEMYRGEMEALVVVWEALGMGSSDKGRFWGELEDLTNNSNSNKTNDPFTSIRASIETIPSSHPESWLPSSLQRATQAYHSLSIRLAKLEKIQSEVTRLRHAQHIKSQILSLDDEIKLLSDRLTSFEEKAGSKQRLLSKKKTNSSNGLTLLEEERFRKHMQATFGNKLEMLGSLLMEWERCCGERFDVAAWCDNGEGLLSDDVRALLENMEDDRYRKWVEQRTAFMHLKTVKTTPTSATTGNYTSGNGGAVVAGATAVLPPPPPPSSSLQRSKSPPRSMNKQNTMSKERKTTASPLRYRQRSSKPAVKQGNAAATFNTTTIATTTTNSSSTPARGGLHDTKKNYGNFRNHSLRKQSPQKPQTHRKRLSVSSSSSSIVARMQSPNIRQQRQHHQQQQNSKKRQIVASSKKKEPSPPPSFSKKGSSSSSLSSSPNSPSRGSKSRDVSKKVNIKLSVLTNNTTTMDQEQQQKQPLLPAKITDPIDTKNQLTSTDNKSQPKLTTATKKGTLLPFGDILAITPSKKENMAPCMFEKNDS